MDMRTSAMDDSFDSMSSEDMRTTPDPSRVRSRLMASPSDGTGMPTTPQHDDGEEFGMGTVRSLNSSFESMPSPEPTAAVPSGARTAPVMQRTVSHLSNDVTPPSGAHMSVYQQRGAATVHRGNIPRPQQTAFSHILLSSKKKGRESMQRQSVPPPHAPVKSPLPRRMSGGRASLPAHMPQGVVQPQRTQSINEDDLREANFRRVGNLGSGSFGSVYLVERQSDPAHRRRRRRYALKVSKQGLYSMHQRQQWFTEAKAMAECNHRNVVQCVGAWVENHRMFILAEYCEFGSLKDYIETLEGSALDEEDIWYILHDVAAGLQHIHGKNLLHLDIKPENLFLSRHVDGVSLSQGSGSGGGGGGSGAGACIELKVGDFGLAVPNSTADMAEAEGGDARYMAPELLNEEPEARAPPADVFSLGATIFELCANVMMPHSNDNWERIRTEPVLAMIAEGIEQNRQDGVVFERSEDLCRLTARLMDPDPSLRPTLEQVLAHPRVQATRRPHHHRMVDSLLMTRSDSMSSSEDVLSTPPATTTSIDPFGGAQTVPAEFAYAGGDLRVDETPDTVRGGVLRGSEDDDVTHAMDDDTAADDEMATMGVRRTLF